MAKTKISQYDATAANNTDINSINIDEGMAPSDVNNAIRELMAEIKQFQAGTSGDTLPVASGGTGQTTAAAALVGLGAITGATGSEVIPTGTTAQRDVTPSTGYFRFNTTLGKFEGYTGSAWGSVGGGATGGGSDDVFVQNTQVVTTSYTIPSGKNAMSTGPLTINSGVVITVPTGSRWVVL